MSFDGKISGSLAPQGARVGSISGNIGAVVPDIRDESVTTAKIADAAVTIAKLAQDVTALINSKGDASDVATLQSDVAALQTITEGLGTASTYGVANNLTTAAAGTDVLDAYQGKLLNDAVDTKLTAARAIITSGNSIYDYVRSMPGNSYALLSVQNASDNPRGSGYVCTCLVYSPGDNGAYALIVANASAETYVSKQLTPTDTAITWYRTTNGQIVWRDYSFENISFSAGTPGTRGVQQTIDAWVDGYTPICARVNFLSDSSACIAYPFYGSASTPHTLYLNLYRATASAATVNVDVRVYFAKD